MRHPRFVWEIEKVWGTAAVPLLEQGWEPYGIVGRYEHLLRRRRWRWWA
jgi:hypothetical protein